MTSISKIAADMLPELETMVTSNTIICLVLRQGLE